MDEYGKSSIGNQLCIDLVTTTSPSTSSSASSITSSPTSPISQESPSLCNVRFHREHSEPGIIINNNNNNNNNNTPTSQNANLTNNTQEMIKHPINNSNNKKAFMNSITHTHRHYSSNNNHTHKKSIKKPTIDTKRTPSLSSTPLLSPYQSSSPPPPIRYNNVYRFYNGGGSNNNKSADFASYNHPDRVIPTDELALFMRNKRRYCPPNFRPIPPSPGGWNEVVPDRTIPWELTCENHTDVSPFLRLRTLDGPLEMPWKSTTIATAAPTLTTTTTTNTTGSWSISFQARHRQQQQILRRDDSRPLHHRSLENVAQSTSSSDASTTHLLSPQHSSSHPSHYAQPSSSSSSLSLPQQCQVYVSPSRSNQQSDLGNITTDEPAKQPIKNKKKMLSPLDTTLTQLLNPTTMAYSSIQSTLSYDSVQELPTQAVQVDTTLQKTGWNLQQQQQQQQQRQDSHHYSHSYSTPPSVMRQQQQQQRTSFELLSPPPTSNDLADQPTRKKIGPIGSPRSLFSPWGNTSPPPPSSTWLHDISPTDDSTLPQKPYHHQQRSLSFSREYDQNTTVAPSYYRTRSRRSLPQKDDMVPSPSTLWKFQPLLSPTSTAPTTESSSCSSSSSSSSSLVWPLFHQQQQQQHYSYHHQRPPTPDEIQDQRSKRSSTSDIQAWQHHHNQQQQQLQQQVHQWTLTSSSGNQRQIVPQQQQQHQQQRQREMDNRSISILRVLDTDNDHSTGHYSLFSKPMVDSSKKEPSPPNDNKDKNDDKTTTGTTTAKNNNHPHHRLYYNFSDYVVVSDA